jgi:phosphatidylinositol phospholipase C epsilon
MFKHVFTSRPKIFVTEDKSSALAKSSSMGQRADSVSSHEGGLRDSRPSQPILAHPALRSQDWLFDEDFSSQKPKKQSSQIAKELSDMIIYIQAIKFRGLNTISPNSSVRSRRPAPSSSTSSVLKKGGVTPTGLTQTSQGASVPGTPTATATAMSSIGSSSASSSLVFATTATSLPIESQLSHSSFSKRPNVHHPCYQCSSLNENSAKKLCRKQPHALVAHTETQLMRTYPAGMRIDSSNFNPVIFWAFGIQMVALNYQTEDAALHINTAMFEQNGRCGYVRKPSVMWDRGHMMYRRFNPWDKEFDGLHSVHLVLTVVSGQYVSQTNFGASVYVEVELLGIPVDCAKQKTKTIQRNAINPIWNDAFFFQIMFRDLAFVRFSILDANTNHLLAQRVLPLTRLKPGYRHIRLRSPQNQPLQLSTLFVYSRTEEESLDTVENGDVPHSGGGGTITVPGSEKNIGRLGKEKTADQELMTTVSESITVPLKRRMFFLMVHGVVPDEPYTILKITQESSTQEVIVQALQKAGLGADRAQDYILVEEVARSWEKKDRDMPATQRVLDLHERPLQAQAQWQGEGRFILKRMGDDPSSRAWLSSIRSTSSISTGRSSSDLSPQAIQSGGRSWDDHDNFLVCVYNVSPEIPYAILKVPLGSSAQDVLAQALVKARRLEDPARFVLVEELEWGGTPQQAPAPQRRRQQRVVADDENVYSTQAHWQTLGRFVLRERGEATPPTGRKRTALNLRAATLEKLSKGLSKRGSDKPPVCEVLSDPSPSTSRLRSRLTSSVGTDAREIKSACSSSSTEGTSSTAGSRGTFKAKQREVHSEGETLSDDERDNDLRNAVSRLKKVSLKKFKVWK